MGNAVLSSPAVSNGVIYVGSDDHNLYAIDAATGEEMWRFTLDNRVYSSPIVSKGVVYVGSVNGNIYAIGKAPSIATNSTVIPTTSNILSSDALNPHNSIPSFPIIISIIFVFFCGIGYTIYLIKRKSFDDSPEIMKNPMRQPEQDTLVIAQPPVMVPPNDAQFTQIISTKPIGRHDVLITYSNKDKLVADAICASLELQSIRCWIAYRDIKPGEIYATSLINAIDLAKIIILVFSHNSHNSPIVKIAIERALNDKKTIIIFRIEDFPPSNELQYLIRTHNWIDAFILPPEQRINAIELRVKVILDNNI
jgi:hypothetical protein